MLNVTPRRSVTDRVLAGLRSVLGGLGESIILDLTSRGINSRGGALTIRNARVWTGNPKVPWAEGLTVRNGRISSLRADRGKGRVIDAGGRLVVPGFHDSHCHPQTPLMLTSPEGPSLFGAATVEDVLATLRRYVEDYPEDRYPRLFGWMTACLPTGQKPTRDMLDRVVADRPCYLVHHSGHEFWANTKALELANIMLADPPDLPATAVIHRDAEGRATGYLEETEFANTDGVLLRTVRKAQPMTEPYQQLALRTILDMYSKVGVTSIWTKDGDLATVGLYEALLARDCLPVRAFLDVLYSPMCPPDRVEQVAARAAALRTSGLAEGFLRSDGIKIMVDLVTDTHQAWLFDGYADRPDFTGVPVFPLHELRTQMIDADARGLCINALAIGDRAVHESLNLLQEVASTNPVRTRRHCIEHAELVRPEDYPRFKRLDIIPSFNPIGAYPDREYQDKLASVVGRERLHEFYQPWVELTAAGAVAVMGSDFPLAPMDPLLGIHILVNGTTIEGEPTGGLWRHKLLPVETALRAYTTNGAYARGEDLSRGTLVPGRDADLVVLSEDILSPAFDTARLPQVKANLTVMNGHVLHEDFTDTPKSLEH